MDSSNHHDRPLGARTYNILYIRRIYSYPACCRIDSNNCPAYNRKKSLKEKKMKNMNKINAAFFVIAFTALAIMAGCASAPLNTEESTSGIRAAEIAGAEKVPKASLHLKLAKEELILAKRYEAKSEMIKAQSMLLRSEADAELALILAREDAEKSKSRAELENVRILKKENQRPHENTKTNN